MGSNRRRTRKENRFGTLPSGNVPSSDLRGAVQSATLSDTIASKKDGTQTPRSSSPADRSHSDSIKELGKLSQALEAEIAGYGNREMDSYDKPVPQSSCDKETPALHPPTHREIATPDIGPGAFSVSQLDRTIYALVDKKLDDLIQKSIELERERTEIEVLRQQLQHAIDSAEVQLAHHGSGEHISSEILQLNESLKVENAKLAEHLSHARREYQALLEFIESEDTDELQSSIRNESLDRERELTEEIDRLKGMLQSFSDEAGSVAGDDLSGELQRQLNDVRNQLMESRHEAVELRLQCNELSTRLAKFQGPTSHSSETFSWEERKQAWLRQLECETKEEKPVDPRKVIEIEHVIEQTDQEIARREQEIADLKSLLEEQAVATNGMAVGAAAIAQLVEADSLIVEERQRLKQLQEEWEQKQRQAEIEMSLERAKLARERLELQEKVRSLEAMQTQSYSTGTGESPSADKRSRGNWLSRLGLRDE